MTNKSICLVIAACVISTASFAQTFKDSTVKIGDSVVWRKAFADETPAAFYGGMEGWRKYLEQNLHYPKKAQRKNIEGVVRVQMIVLQDGSVSEIKALNDPGAGLAEEAERVIRDGPKWKPAFQNGRKVTYGFVQTITFQLE